MAHIRKIRKIWSLWILVQLCGLALLFVYPLGTIAGLLLIVTGFALGTTSVCSRCGKQIAADAKKCPYCKESLTGRA